MPYEPTTFVNGGPPPFSAQEANKLGLGLRTVSLIAESAQSEASSAVQGDDPRLSDARNPLTHTHPVSDLTGKLPVSQLSTTGTASASTILYGDGVWRAFSHTHTAAQISDATTDGRALIRISSTSAALTYLGAAAANHTHSLNSMTGTLSPSQMGTGTPDAGKVLFGDGTWREAPSSGGGGGIPNDDPRLSDARTPLPHTHPTTDLTGKLALNQLSTTGTASASTILFGDGQWKAFAHTHPATDLTGKLNLSQLNTTGTASASTVLYGDGQWKAFAHTHTAADVSDATTTGRALLTTASAAAARTTLDAAQTSHTHTAANISDASTVGRDLLKAATSAAARALIDAATTVHTHAVSELSDATPFGRNLLKFADAAATRVALGAAALSHTHTAADVSDATATGRDLMKASSKASAQAYLGIDLLSNGAVINLAAYAPAGNGTTDDAPKLQSALDAAAATTGPSVVFVPGGRSYGIGTTIRLPANVTLEGGPGARLVTTNGNTMMCNFTAGDSTTTAYNGRGNIVVRNLIMDMRAHQQTEAHDCLLFSHAENLRVENVTFRNCSSYHHLEFNACKNGRVLNCRFEGWKNNTGSAANDYREAVQIDYAIGSTTPGAQDNTPCQDITVDGCWFGPSAECGSVGRAVGSHTVASGGSAYESIKVVNCTIESPIFEGIRAYSWKNSLVQNNVILNAARTAIALDAATGVSASNAVVANNSITGGCSVAAIAVRSTNSGTNAYSNTNISGNVVNATTAGVGILCEHTNHPVVVGNKLNNIDGDGIRCTDSIGSNISSNALVTIGGSGISVAGGRQHTITSNYSWGVTGGATVQVTGAADYTLVQGNNIYSANTTPTGVDVTGAKGVSILSNQLYVAKAACITLGSGATGCTILGNMATGAASTWIGGSNTAYISHGGSLAATTTAGANVVHA